MPGLFSAEQWRAGLAVGQHHPDTQRAGKSYRAASYSERARGRACSSVSPDSSVDGGREESRNGLGSSKSMYFELSATALDGGWCGE